VVITGSKFVNSVVGKLAVVKRLLNLLFECMVQTTVPEIITDADFGNALNRVLSDSEKDFFQSVLRRNGIKVDCEKNNFEAYFVASAFYISSTAMAMFFGTSA